MSPSNFSAMADAWLRKELANRPERAAQLESKLEALKPKVALESATPESQRDQVSATLEAIIKEERPVLLVLGDKVTKEGAFIAAGANKLMDALEAARAKIEPVIPLVGRIDVANSFRFDYVGTGWLIAPDVAVTNRHVAKLIANQNNGGFRFALNHERKPLEVSLNYRREFESADDTARAFKVKEVIFIETNEDKADIAFLKVERQADGTKPTHIELDSGDAPRGTEVCVIGYPARSNAAPDPDLMDRMFKGTYDIKRLSPGETMGINGPSATHDCTTLGGNSGSVVVSMKTGKAVALHFAGAFALENYAVPVSVVADYKKRLEAGTLMASIETGAAHADDGPPFDIPAAAQQQAPTIGATTFTVPLTITVALGDQAPVTIAAAKAQAPALPPAEAARELRKMARSSAIRAVRPGFTADASGELTDQACIQVLASPGEVDRVKREAPTEYRGLPVVVREAGPFDLAPAFDQEAVTSIKYDDDKRNGSGFSFEPVNEPIELRCHVGPERSWITLQEFLDRPKQELVTSIYEFHAPWIADKIRSDTILKGKTYTLVMGGRTRDSAHASGNDTFERQATFADWDRLAHGKFERIYVPTGSNGLVASNYHIKVTVKDGDSFWLSSGNWKSSSQPAIADVDANSSAVTLKAGNREWHVVAKNRTLAQRFRNHILQDFKRSGELGGSLEAADIEEEYVLVPEALLRDVELEAARPAPILEPKTFKGKIKIEPLLTPDKKGDVYCDAVLRLIESAEKQLLFQIPYITAFRGGDRLVELADALVKKSKEIDDCRVILRAENDPAAGAQDLKGRGMNVKKCVRKVFKTHTKGMVADGKRVLVGSHNWSGLGVTLNRDASLIIHDEGVADYYREAFEIDWERASAVRLQPAGGSIRPAIGNEAPPPGYRRVRLSEVVEG